MDRIFHWEEDFGEEFLETFCVSFLKDEFGS